MQRPVPCAARAPRSARLRTLLFAFLLALTAMMGRSARAATLAITAPADGAAVTTKTVTVRAAASDFAPASVHFYEAVGTPDDSWTDRYLGSGDRAPDGSYSVTATFADGPNHLVYVQVVHNNAVVRATSTFTVDRRTGPTALDITAPASNGAVASNTVTVRALPVHFKPDVVQFYQAVGTMDDSWTDRYLGSDGEAAADGSFEVTADFVDGGPYLVYAYYHDGFDTVRGTVSFTVNARPSVTLALAASTVAACGETLGTVSISPAPANGAAVSLSADSAAVTLPASVGIPAGQASVSFPVGGAPVRAATPVKVTAAWSGLSASANLTVNPYPHYAFVVEDLGTLGGSYSVATAISENGQAAGYGPTASGAVHAFLTGPDGKPVDITPGGADKLVAWDINDAGQVAGYRQTGTGPRVAFRTDGQGAVHALATPGGTDAYAQSINAIGQVVGDFTASDGQVHAFRAEADGTVTDLGVLAAGGYSCAMGVNDAGQVAGYASNAAGTDVGYRTANGAGVPGATVLGTYVYGYGLNRDGVVTGEMWDSAAVGYSMFRTDASGMPKILGTLPGHWSYGFRINASGSVVGVAYTYDSASGTSTERRALLYTDAGGLKDLNTLIDPASGWELIAAYDINDAGQIVGYGKKDNQFRACRLTLTVPNLRYGDADGDGTVAAPDVVALLRMAGGMLPVTDLLVCDVAPAPACNPRGFGDGTVDVRDALRVARRLLGLEPVWT